MYFIKKKIFQLYRDYQILCQTFCIFCLIITGITKLQTVFLQDCENVYHEENQ